MNSRYPERSGHRLDTLAFTAVLLATFLATGSALLEAALIGPPAPVQLLVAAPATPQP